MIEELKSFSVTREVGKFGRKSGIVWGNKGNSESPIMYLSKPKWVSDEDFAELLNCIQIKFIKKEK
jgi:hypothetical protein